jgi:hypothetical protein
MVARSLVAQIAAITAMLLGACDTTAVHQVELAIGNTTTEPVRLLVVADVDEGGIWLQLPAGSKTTVSSVYDDRGLLILVIGEECSVQTPLPWSRVFLPGNQPRAGVVIFDDRSIGQTDYDDILLSEMAAGDPQLAADCDG